MLGIFEIFQIWTKYVKLSRISPYLKYFKVTGLLILAVRKSLSREVKKSLRLEKCFLTKWNECIRFRDRWARIFANCYYLVIAPFVERFETATVRVLLINFISTYKNLLKPFSFKQIIPSANCFAKESGHCSFRWAS